MIYRFDLRNDLQRNVSETEITKIKKIKGFPKTPTRNVDLYYLRLYCNVFYLVITNILHVLHVYVYQHKYCPGIRTKDAVVPRPIYHSFYPRPKSFSLVLLFLVLSVLQTSLYPCSRSIFRVCDKTVLRY